MSSSRRLPALGAPGPSPLGTGEITLNQPEEAETAYNSFRWTILQGTSLFSRFYSATLSVSSRKQGICIQNTGGGRWETTNLMRANSEQLAPPQVALSFNKGCYLGQEIVERIRSRGSVHRHLRPLELSGPVPAAGAELKLEGGAIAGQITSAAELPLLSGSRVFALGMMRGEAELRNQSFTYSHGTATGTAHILAAPPVLEVG
jgi:folate-binding protein YgfZ